jgi:thiazole synthase ThiGH ThiG subunit
MEVLGASLVASEASIATVALRRVDPNVKGSIYDLLGRLNFSLLPNTAGCYSAAEAVKVAELAREAFETNVVKLEVIGDDVTLLPDTSPRRWSPPRRWCAAASRSGPTRRTTSSWPSDWNRPAVSR